MWLKRQVVMLPTNERASLKLGQNGLLVNNTLGYDSHFINQNLYFLSDEEVKEGDWQYTKLFGISQAKNLLWSKEEGAKKIIATTDLKLVLGDGRALFHGDGQPKIETPSQSFIEKFVEEYNKGNIIKEVLVEYEEDSEQICRVGRDLCDVPLRLKINPKDNTISIRKLKNSWNREEVIEFAEKYARMVQEKPIQLNAYKRIHNHVWIEQNL